jgi:hypothetical protein
MITQIHTSIDPEIRMWGTFSDNVRYVGRNNQTIRTYVGDKMGFRPQFTPHGTHYINTMQSNYIRLVNLMAIRYYDSFKERHQFCKQTDETQEYNSIFSKLKRLFKRS